MCIAGGGVQITLRHCHATDLLPLVDNRRSTLGHLTAVLICQLAHDVCIDDAARKPTRRVDSGRGEA